MAATERITMTMRELDRYKVIQAVADGMLKPWRAAERLGLTTRQIRRLAARLREDGPGGLVSRRRAKPSNNRLDATIANRALAIIRDRYADFGPTLACEKLWERLSHALQVAEAIQAQRDNRRISGSPSRANRGLPVRTKTSLPGAKKQRAFTEADIDAAILQVASQTHPAESNRVFLPIPRNLKIRLKSLCGVVFWGLDFAFWGQIQNE